ncbi:MAG: Ig domain-containing protein [Myxococcota bacterium]
MSALVSAAMALSAVAQVDLQPSSITPQGVTFLAEDPVEFILELEAGDYAGEVEVRVWASADMMLDPADILVIDEPVTVASSTGSFALSGPSPGPTGSFFAIVELDPADMIPEADEGNNELTSSSNFNLAGIDLELERLIVQTSPPLILGATRSFRIDVLNRGPSLASQVELGLFLRAAGGDEEELVPFTSIGALPANNRDTASGSFDIPPAAPAGAAEIIARARLSEPVRETNPADDFVVQQVVLVNPLPNLRGEIGSAPSTAEAGASITVQRVVENDGVEDGTVATELLWVLSLDDQIEVDDLVIATENTPRLTVDALDVVDSTIDLPLTLTATTYRLGMVIDPTNLEDETIEEDNFVVGPLIDVFPPDLAIVTSTLPIARTGTAYEVALIGVGGTVARTWFIPDEQLPMGLILDGDAGIISGVPSEEGVFPLDVELRSGPASVQRRVDLRVADPTLPLQITQDNLPPTVVGRGYQAQLVAQGGLPPYTWSGVGLPAGVALGPGGVVSGTPTVQGDFSLTVQVEDDLGEIAIGVVTLLVVPESDGVAFIPTALAQAIVGEAYAFQLEAVGGQPPFSFTGAGLPPGLSLTEAGLLGGTPSEVGVFRFTLSVRNQLGIVSSEAFELQVVDDGQLRILSSILPGAEVGTAYDVALESNGGTPPLQWRLFGDEPLPPGLMLDEAGLLSGVPSAANVFRFAVELRDGAGRLARAPLELRVEGGVPADGGDGGCQGGSGSSGPWLVLLSLLWGVGRARRAALAPRP